MPVKPIKPSEVKKRKKDTFPDEVIASFNELITKHYKRGKATVYAKDVVALIVSRMSISEDEIYENEYLDVEDVFKQQGWKVEYEQPSYGDNNFDAYFTFTAKSGD